jgi:hypothetical protein
MDREWLRLGMPGTATVFADNAGVIGLLMAPIKHSPETACARVQRDRPPGGRLLVNGAHEYDRNVATADRPLTPCLDT